MNRVIKLIPLNVIMFLSSFVIPDVTEGKELTSLVSAYW